MPTGARQKQPSTCSSGCSPCLQRKQDRGRGVRRRQTRSPLPVSPLLLRGGGAPFQCLGYDGEASYYRSGRTGQVLRLARSAHTATHLVALAPLAHWETLYPSRTGVNWSAVASDLYERSIAVGLFTPDRIRGRGAWWDDGRPLLHLGDRLVTPEGEHLITTPFRSRYVYQRMPRLDGPGDVEPLSVQEAAVIVSIANRFRWDVPASGTLLVGWVVLGPICGSLRWRPHVWLTGGAGSGKSAILDRYITPLLGDFALLVSGSTTEAAPAAVDLLRRRAGGVRRGGEQRAAGSAADAGDPVAGAGGQQRERGRPAQGFSQR